MFKEYRINKKIIQIRENFLFSTFEFGMPSSLTALDKTVTNEELIFVNNLANACSKILPQENSIIKNEKTTRQISKIFEAALSIIGEQKYLSVYNDLTAEDVKLLQFPIDRTQPLYIGIENKADFIEKYGWITNPKIFKGSIMSQKRQYFDAVKTLADDGRCNQIVNELIRDAAKRFNAPKTNERVILNRAINANVDRFIQAVDQKIEYEKNVFSSSIYDEQNNAEK